MDSLTHIAIGSCIGVLYFEKGFGKKAMFWGALSQSIPDIDFIAATWLSTPEALLAHRAFTHSLFFLIIAAVFFSLLAEKIHRPHNITFLKWFSFFIIELSTHLFLDLFNNYGVGLFEPFSHLRFSFNALYVVDPFFSLFPISISIVLLWIHHFHPKRYLLARISLLIPAFYLLLTVTNKIIVQYQIQKIFQIENIPNKYYFSTPAPLQNFLWYVVAGNDSGYFIGYYSVFNSKNKIDFTFFPKRIDLIEKIHDHENLQRLIRFSQGYFTLQTLNNKIVFNDLRFGQAAGWQNPKADFVFHYYLNHPTNNKLIIQQGRVSNLNFGSLSLLFKKAINLH